MNNKSMLKKGALIISGLFCMAQLNGCATGTAGLECGMESMNPTIMAALDSFESAAISIKLSNRILLETPISEGDKWPAELFGAPSGAALFKMGLSLFGSAKGVTIPTELDRETGFPKPTSSLYIFLKDREKMLNKEIAKDDIRFFAAQPPGVIARQVPAHRRKPAVQMIDDNIYRNPLMAYGVVTANQAEVVKLQQEIDLIAQGFKLCDAWVHKSSAGDIKPAACKDPALKQDALEARLKKASYTTSPETPDNGNGKPQSSMPSGTYTLAEYYGNNAASQADGSANPAPVIEKKATPVPKKVLSKKERNNLKKNRNKKKKTTDEEVIAQAPLEAAPAAAAKTGNPAGPGIYANERVIVVNERDRLTSEKTAELETMKKNYGKLAERVNSASVAGADFTMAALTKIACAIVNGIKAAPNAQKEIKTWRGSYNAVVLVPRINAIIRSFGYYKDNLGLQFVAYRTMYQQVQGTYPELKDDESKKTQEAMLRIEIASAALKQLEPKLEMLAAGRDVSFEESEIMQLNYIATLFPAQQDMAQELRVAWGME